MFPWSESYCWWLWAGHCHIRAINFLMLVFALESFSSDFIFPTFFNILTEYFYQNPAFVIFLAVAEDDELKNICFPLLVFFYSQWFIGDSQIHIVSVSSCWWITGIPSLWRDVCFRECISKIQLHLMSPIVFYKKMVTVSCIALFLKLHTEIPL